MSGDGETIYEAVGEAGVAGLVHEFYRHVPEDPILSPMYPPDDLAGAEQRLRSFLIYRLGGPPDYLQERGHPALRMRHAPFAITPAARDRWIQLMQQALATMAFAPAVTEAIQQFLEHTATFLINRPD